MPALNLPLRAVAKGEREMKGFATMAITAGFFFFICDQGQVTKIGTFSTQEQCQYAAGQLADQGFKELLNPAVKVLPIAPTLPAGCFSGN